MISIVLEIGLIALLIYLPLASGGVTEVSIALLEIWAGLLVVGWGLSLVFTLQEPLQRRERRQRHRSKSSFLSRWSFQKTSGLHLIWPPALGALMTFLALTALQLFPWPVKLVGLLSPETLELYTEALSNTFGTLPGRLPLSVVTQASETELGKLVASVLLFWVVINVIRTQAQIHRIIGILLGMGGVEAVYGLSQMGQARIAGTFVNHNHFAGYLEMLVPLTFGLLLAQLESHSSSTPGRVLIKWVDDKYLKTLLFGVLIVVLSLALFFSGSRGGVLSFSAGMIGFCLLAYSRRLLRKWMRVILLSMLIVFGIAVFASPEALLQRLGALAKPAIDTSFQYRRNVWENSLAIVRDFPVFGSGVGTFSHLFARYQKFPSDLHFTHTENDYLQVLTETGGLGFVVVVWGIIAYGRRTILAWRRQRLRWPVTVGLGGLISLFSMAVHSCMDFNLQIPSNRVAFLVIAAITYTCVHLEREQHDNVDAFTSDTNVHHNQPERYACSAIIRSYQLPRLRLYAILLIGLAGVVGFMAWCGRPYVAHLWAQHFFETAALTTRGYDSESVSETAELAINQAIRWDRNHGGYAFALGDFLYQQAVQHGKTADIDEYVRLLDEAEEWLNQAVWQDPANPWYYYNLGRVSLLQGTCEQSEGAEADFDRMLAVCPTARHYFLALRNAPNNAFLRRFAGGWFYRYDQALAFAMMSRILNVANSQPPSAVEEPRMIAQFLYDMHLENESEHWRRQYAVNPLASCERPDVLRTADNLAEIELGSDDGSAEWRAILISDGERVHKEICLPDSIEAYSEGVLKILMNNGGNGNFTAQIVIDETVIHEFTPVLSVPRESAWYDIPFDPQILRGKKRIQVYIRVSGASWSGNYLQIWGDQQTSSGRSTWNLDRSDDLSPDQGLQTGEYLIRLVLKGS